MKIQMTNEEFSFKKELVFAFAEAIETGNFKRLLQLLLQPHRYSDKALNNSLLWNSLAVQSMCVNSGRTPLAYQIAKTTGFDAPPHEAYYLLIEKEIKYVKKVKDATMRRNK